MKISVTLEKPTEIFEFNGYKDARKRLVKSAFAHWNGYRNENLKYFSNRTYNEVESEYGNVREADILHSSPEELFAESLACGFNMYVASALRGIGLKPSFLDTNAHVFLQNNEIESVHISISGVIGKITAGAFYAIVKDVEKNCPITKVLKVPVTTEAILSLKIPQPEYA